MRDRCRNAVRMMASATTVSAAAMVMTNSGSTLPAAHRSAPAAWVATSSTRPPLEHQLDADEQQDGVAAHRDAEHAEPDEGGGEQVRAGEVDHEAASGGRRLGAGSSARRASAATSAMSSSTDSSSKGHTQVPNSCAGHLGGADVGALHRLVRQRQQHRAEQQRRPAPPSSGRAEGAPRADGVREVGPDGRPGEHQREEHEHDDRADVDEHEHQGDQLGAEHEQRPGDPEQRDDQPQRGVHDVPGRHGEQAPGDGHQRGGRERRVECGHVASSAGGGVGRARRGRRHRLGVPVTAPRRGRHRAGRLGQRAGRARPRADAPCAASGTRAARSAAPPPRTARTDQAGAASGLVRRGDLGRLGRFSSSGGRRRHGGHPLAEPVLLVQQVADVDLGVLELRAPVQRVERAHLDADAAVHAQGEVDGEPVEHVALAVAAALGGGRDRLLVRVDVDAPVGALARAEHARRCSSPRAAR